MSNVRNSTPINCLTQNGIIELLGLQERVTLGGLPKGAREIAGTKTHNYDVLKLEGLAGGKSRVKVDALTPNGGKNGELSVKLGKVARAAQKNTGRQNVNNQHAQNSNPGKSKQ